LAEWGVYALISSVAGEEGRSGDMGGGRAVAVAGGSLYPDEVAVSVSDEEETTRGLEGFAVVEDGEAMVVHQRASAKEKMRRENEGSNAIVVWVGWGWRDQ
jgi:hypothetical protein